MYTVPVNVPLATRVGGFVQKAAAVELGVILGGIPAQDSNFLMSFSLAALA